MAQRGQLLVLPGQGWETSWKI